MNRPQNKRFYVFGVFRIDLTERVVFSDQGVVPLTPKAFDTLLVLVENCNHTLGKRELIDKIWPDSFVEENNLAQNISILRRALGQCAADQEFIQTVPKRGYRFVAEVKEAWEEDVGLVV
jgi:DNA-binding winged helix-turn-helix (wHTH) protein